MKKKKQDEPISEIPPKLEVYPEGEGRRMTISDDGLTYKDTHGNIVDVVYWVRYPSYDFIFGVPAEGNPYREKEVGFFQYRNTKHKKVIMGVYVDCNELEELAYGFKKIIEVSKLNSPEIWKEHAQRKAEVGEVEIPIPKNAKPTIPTGFNTPTPTRKARKSKTSKKK